MVFGSPRHGLIRAADTLGVKGRKLLWKLAWPGWAAVPAIIVLLAAAAVWQHAVGPIASPDGMSAVVGIAGFGVVVLLLIAVAATRSSADRKSWAFRFAAPLLFITVLLLSTGSVAVGFFFAVVWWVIVGVDDPRAGEKAEKPNRESRIRWGLLVQNVVGVTGCLGVGMGVRAGWTWYAAVIVLSFVLLVFFGLDRLFRIGVQRTGEAIVCRYVPWYQGSTYLSALVFPLMGAGIIGMALAPGSTLFALIWGIPLVALTPVMLTGIVRMARRCLVIITLSELALRSSARGATVVRIRREDVESVKLMSVKVGRADGWQVEIVHRTADSVEPTVATIGPPGKLQVTVEPHNLYSALVTWKGDFRTEYERSRLLDGIEATLRARRTLIAW